MNSLTAGDEFTRINYQGLIDSYRSALAGIARIRAAMSAHRAELRPVLRDALHARRVLRDQLKAMRIDP